MIPPGSTIGVLGGGQLGRMLAMAAAQLGYHVHIYAPGSELVAGEVAGRVTRAGWDDEAALTRFANACDVITYEFENIPAKTVAFLQSERPVRPGLASLDIGQDRLSEKQFVESLGGATAPYHAVENLDDLLAGLDALGVPAILKTRRFGYDGKGQVRITDRQQAADALASLGREGLLLEGLVRFPAEFSILMARAADGRTTAWPACQNRHDDGILAETIVPAVAIDPAHVASATALVTRMAHELSYIGVLACEFFATASGPVFNEMAPRVHNSGHWTIEGARTSQFEQHIRAICGLPFGAVELTAPNIVMRNLLGDAVGDWASLLGDPRTHLHLYAKSAALPGRKMGHVTIIGA